MVKTKTEMKAGSHVEVRHGPLIIIGRIVWTLGTYSGVHSQGLIDTAEALRAAKLKSAMAASAVSPQPSERRKDELRHADQRSKTARNETVR